MKEGKNIRILYAAGPGNVVEAFSCWLKGGDDPHEVARTYSGQFFNVCKKENITGLIISSNSKKAKLSADNITAKHRPIPLVGASGWLYHLGQVIYAFYLLSQGLWFRADAIVIQMGTHWFMLTLFKLFGIKVVPSLHCVLWLKDQKMGFTQKLLNKLNKFTFSKSVFAILSISNDVTRQVKFLTKNHNGPIITFNPFYDINNKIPQKEKPKAAIKTVTFIGRVEESKGIYTILNAFNKLAKETDLMLNFCGNGTELENLKRIVLEGKYSDRIHIHGHCYRDELHKIISETDVFIVPTTKDFIEGFNKVVVEGILSATPVITTAVCPAVEYVKDAVLLFEPGNSDDLANKIQRLITDVQLYQSMHKAALRYTGYFYNYDNSWESAFSLVVKHLKEDTIPTARYTPVENPLLPDA